MDDDTEDLTAVLDGLVATTLGGGGVAGLDGDVTGDGLEALVAAVEERIGEVKDEVYATVKGHSGAISSTFACVNELQGKVAELRGSLGRVIDAVENPDVS